MQVSSLISNCLLFALNCKLILFSLLRASQLLVILDCFFLLAFLMTGHYLTFTKFSHLRCIEVSNSPPSTLKPGLVQKPQGQIPQEAAQPPEGAASEAEGCIGGRRQWEGGCTSLCDSCSRHPAPSFILLLLFLHSGGRRSSYLPCTFGHGAECHLSRTLRKRVSDRRQRHR